MNLVEKAVVPHVIKGFFDVNEERAYQMAAIEGCLDILCDAKYMIKCLFVFAEARLIF